MTPFCLLCQQPVADGNARFCSETCEHEAARTVEAFGMVIWQQKFSLAEFQVLLHDHLLRDVLRLILWRQGQQEFMVCEDYTFADVHSNALTLHAEPTITPLSTLSDAWRLVLYDYGLIPLVFNEQYDPPMFSQLRYIPLLRLAVRHFDSLVREAIAQNPHCPPDLLTELASDPSALVRRYVAEHAVTPIELFAQLAQDYAEGVRCGVAKNPRAPENLLILLSQDFNRVVRQTVAQQPHAPEAALTALANDFTPYIQRLVAENPHTPLSLVQQLAQNPNALVRKVAEKALAQRQPS